MRYYRKIIRITAEDSPNVRLAMAQIKAGKEPTNEILVPGVLPWADYVKRRSTWDEVRQCIGLDAMFYKGLTALLYPPQWLNHSNTLAVELHGKERQALSIGVDPAEGGDRTVYAVGDRMGLLDLISKSTPDTSVIVKDIIDLINYHKINPRRVVFDAGGGGKQHADVLRRRGYRVKTVRFGEAATLEGSGTGYRSFGEDGPGGERLGDNPRTQIRRTQQEVREERYVYRTRRAQLYGVFSMLMNPQGGNGGYALPARFVELRRQLALIPRTYDSDGRLTMLPKHRKKGSSEKCLTDIIGNSPDEADATVLMVYGAFCVSEPRKIGGF